jgi:hypothetical protein
LYENDHVARYLIIERSMLLDHIPKKQTYKPPNPQACNPTSTQK